MPLLQKRNIVILSLCVVLENCLILGINLTWRTLAYAFQTSLELRSFNSKLIGDESVSFYGVFDGHGGEGASQFVRDNLPRIIVNDANFPLELEQVVTSSFMETDVAFARSCALESDLSSSTTALTAMIFGRSLLVANVGDCRAILSRHGIAFEMSKDHRPYYEKEILRIESLGGFVEDGYLNGHIAMTRAIGNWHIQGLKEMVSKSIKMEVQSLAMDTMSNLPSSIIQKVVSHMPMRDAFRTSILSQNWRDYCLNIPKLKFDDEVFQGAALKNLSINYKLLHVIYPILLLHKGPILDFSLCLSQLSSCREIDQIILNLSRNATVKKFTLSIGVGDDHKLLPSFFMLQQLVILELQNCAFQPPSAFKGFSKLISLSFNNVSITSKAHLRFIVNCPLLKDFTLIGDEKHFMGCWNCDFIELFECLPSIECLHMSLYPIKCFAIGAIPKKLPTSLDHLIYLCLSGVSFGRDIELQSALLLVTSSPKIETVVIEMDHNPKESVSKTAMDLLDLQDYLHVTLDHLRVIQIKDFTNMKPGMDFVKLILAKSPMLKLIDIMIDKRVDIHDEVKMLKELIQYPRASTRAEIIFERP